MPFHNRGRTSRWQPPTVKKIPVIQEAREGNGSLGGIIRSRWSPLRLFSFLGILQTLVTQVHQRPTGIF